MTQLLAEALRPGRCDNDTERTVARWLIEAGGDVTNVAKAAGIHPDVINVWIDSMPTRSELRVGRPVRRQFKVSANAEWLIELSEDRLEQLVNDGAEEPRELKETDWIRAAKMFAMGEDPDAWTAWTVQPLPEGSPA